MVWFQASPEAVTAAFTPGTGVVIAEGEGCLWTSRVTNAAGT